jgi:hypothetical protein
MAFLTVLGFARVDQTYGWNPREKFAIGLLHDYLLSLIQSRASALQSSITPSSSHIAKYVSLPFTHRNGLSQHIKFRFLVSPLGALRKYFFWVCLPLPALCPNLHIQKILKILLKLIKNLPVAIETPNRRASKITRVVRSNAFGDWVKRLHGFTCEICGTALETTAGAYAETCHIQRRPAAVRCSACLGDFIVVQLELGLVERSKSSQASCRRRV